MTAGFSSGKVVLQGLLLAVTDVKSKNGLDMENLSQTY
jgi:hypothetical protein